MASKFRQLFDQNVMRSMDKQKAMVEIHPQQKWEFDQQNCVLTLTESGVSFQVQILGMENLATNTWRWGWGEEMSDYPNSGLIASKKIQLLGQKYEIPEFTTDGISLDEISAQDIAIIASGVLKASCYWAVGQQDQFSLYMLIMPEQIEITPDTSVTHLTVNIPQTIGAMEIQNHKRAIKSYLMDSGYEAVQAPGEIVAVSDGTPKITMAFDEMNRLTEIKASLSAGDAGQTVADAAEVDTPFGDGPVGQLGNAAEQVGDAGQAAAGSPFGAVAAGVAGAAGLGAAGIAGAGAMAANATEAVEGVAADAGDFDTFSFGNEGDSAVAGSAADESAADGMAPAVEGAKKKSGGLLKILLLVFMIMILLAVIGWAVFTFIL